MPAYPRCTVAITLLMEDWGAGTSIPYTLTATPRSVEIVRNDARQADTCTVVLDYRDFPFDPRTYRAGIVQVALGDVGTATGALDVDKALAFAGCIDTPKTIRAEEGQSVSIECRDFTAYFLDQKWADGAVNVDVDLYTVVYTIMQGVVGATGILLGFSDGCADLVLASQLGRKTWTPTAGDDTWTVLCDLLGRVGLVPVMDADVLLVLAPADFGADRATFIAQNKLVPTGVQLTYGRNVRSLGYLRRFKEARTVQIEVRAYDEAARKVTTARYPTTAIAVKRKVSAKGKVTGTDAPILPFFLSGSYTADQLATIAERTWTEQARQEIELELETAELADENGQAIPTLGNGARLTISINGAVPADIASMTQAQAVAVLSSGDRALARDVATALVASLSAANSLAVQFYVRDIRHSWSREQGYKATITAINYIAASA